MGEMRKLTIEEVLKVPMPFGKHKGVALGDIPTDYVAWLARYCNMADVKDHAKRIMVAEDPSLQDPDNFEIPF